MSGTKDDLVLARRAKIIEAPRRIQGLLDRELPAGQRLALQALYDRLMSVDLAAAADEILPPHAAGADKLFGEKYLDIGGRARVSAAFAERMGLMGAAPMSLLDIGAGAGYFCWAAKCFGHRAVALEPENGDGVGSIDHTAIVRLLGLPHSQQWIMPLERLQADEGLKAGERFDFVTSFAIMFNHSRKRDGDLRRFWTAEDYLFFLADIRDRLLKPGGKVFLLFNEQLFGEPSTPFTSPSVAAYYLQLGKLLEPFIVSHERGAGTLLDVWRPEAWRAAQTMTLDPPNDDSVTNSELGKTTEMSNAWMKSRARIQPDAGDGEIR